MNEVIIDGSRFGDYHGFVEEFNRAYTTVFGGAPWDGDDLADLYDMLDNTGGPLTVRWLDSQASRTELGHEKLRQYWLCQLDELKTHLPDNAYLHEQCQKRIDDAAAGRGKTLFEWLLFQIADGSHFVNVELE